MEKNKEDPPSLGDRLVQPIKSAGYSVYTPKDRSTRILKGNRYIATFRFQDTDRGVLLIFECHVPNAYDELSSLGKIVQEAGRLALKDLGKNPNAFEVKVELGDKLPQSRINYGESQQEPQSTVTGEEVCNKLEEILTESKTPLTDNAFWGRFRKAMPGVGYHVYKRCHKRLIREGTIQRIKEGSIELYAKKGYQPPPVPVKPSKESELGKAIYAKKDYVSLRSHRKVIKTEEDEQKSIALQEEKKRIEEYAEKGADELEKIIKEYYYGMDVNELKRKYYPLWFILGNRGLRGRFVKEGLLVRK